MSWRLPFLKQLAVHLDCSIMATRCDRAAAAGSEALPRACSRRFRAVGWGGVRREAADSAAARRSYRGYGLSSGKPSEGGLQMDAEAALQYLLHSRPDIDRWLLRSAQATTGCWARPLLKSLHSTTPLNHASSAAHQRPCGWRHSGKTSPFLGGHWVGRWQSIWQQRILPRRAPPRHLPRPATTCSRPALDARPTALKVARTVPWAVRS